MNPILFYIELIDFKTRRVAAFRKNLVELAELELKHAKVIMVLFWPLFQLVLSIKCLINQNACVSFV